MNFRKALITGASSGIGMATARVLAAAGLDLILLSRRRERLEEMKKQLEKSGVSVTAMDIDVRDFQMLKSRFSEMGGIEDVDVLVNSAGLAKGVSKLPDLDMSDATQMIETNINGLLYVTRLLLPQMIKNKRGHIINLGSVAGRWVYPGAAVYCATKFAVRALSEGLRMDVLGTPIRITNIEPGMVETEFSEVRLGNSERAKAVYKNMRPLTAEDVADSIRWCLERPPHVNVQEIVLYPTDQASVQMVHRSEAAKPS